MIRDIEILFPLVWKNIYIKSQIFKHLLLYNLHFAYREYTSLDSFLLFKNKNYLNEVNLNFNIEYHDDFESILPENITKLSHTDSTTHIHFKSFPNFINSLYITQHDIQLFKLINKSNLKSLRIIYNSNNSNNINNNNNNSNNSFNNNNHSSNQIIEIIENSLPASLNELTLINYPFQIKENIFSNCLNLKKLIVNGYCQVESLPKSLLEFSYGDEDSPAMKLKSDLFPCGLKVLKLFSSLYDRYIIPNGFQFPNKNLVHLDISLSHLDNFIIPSSLQSLEIEVNESYSNILLEQLEINYNNGGNLKSLGFNSTNILNSNGLSVLPKSLERLVFKYFRDINYNNQLFTNQLPSKLKHLSFDINNFNYSFENGFNNGGYSLSSDSIQFSNSLTYLNFGDAFNQKININVLPDTLKTLILGESFDQEIIKDSIPFNLELLRIRNKHYQKPIQLDNNYTLVDCRLYYRQFMDQDKKDQLIVFKVPWEFNQKLKELSLHNKSKLEYLDLNNFFYNRSIITGFDLPLDNCIKTLVLGYPFDGTIKLEDFVHLENLIVNDSNPTLLAQDIYDVINFYSLKTITIKSSNTRFIDSLNKIFYKFINLIK